MDCGGLSHLKTTVSTPRQKVVRSSFGVIRLGSFLKISSSQWSLFVRACISGFKVRTSCLANISTLGPDRVWLGFLTAGDPQYKVGPLRFLTFHDLYGVKREMVAWHKWKQVYGFILWKLSFRPSSSRVPSALEVDQLYEQMLNSDILSCIPQWTLSGRRRRVKSLNPTTVLRYFRCHPDWKSYMG